MTRLLGVLVTVLLAWCGVMQPVQASVPTPVAAVANYAYDACHHTAVPTCTTTERGPPAEPCRDIANPAVGHRPDGALAGSATTATSIAYTYDALAPLAQAARVAGTTHKQVKDERAALSALGESGVAAETGATNFVGRKGVTKFFDDGSHASYGGEISIARGTNAPGVVNGRSYSGHAFDQMQGRGITPSVVDDAVGSGLMSRGADGSRIFYSSENNISVVVNSDGRVITVGYGAFKPR